MISSRRVLRPTNRLYAFSLTLLDEFIAAFRVFDKEKSGMIGAGELKYILTELGEKMSEEEVQELMNATQMGAYVNHDLLIRHQRRH